MTASKVEGWWRQFKGPSFKDRREERILWVDQVSAARLACTTIQAWSVGWQSPIHTRNTFALVLCWEVRSEPREGNLREQRPQQAEGKQRWSRLGAEMRCKDKKRREQPCSALFPQNPGKQITIYDANRGWNDILGKCLPWSIRT